ncbi:MAG: tetratricopeptide repeat protein [Magnetococcales bacterium]|nr:tetratricopeptide repeat protein [Magnetococcales bacterium]
MDLQLLERFRRIIANQTGLVMPERDDPILRTKLGLRTHALRFPGMESYLNLLEEESPESRCEWQTLIRELTTVESYFFRDAGQIRLLQEVILPELLRRRQRERALRVWSAGCASGEEPYSIAMLLQPMLPQEAHWQVTILGTDINDIPLQRAVQARYGQWAFRGVDLGMVARHFDKRGEEWQLEDTIREMVEFRILNLLKDEFPSPGLSELDLIVCRNVFIYFDRTTIARVVKKFARALRPGGYLLTGHGEIPHPMTDILGLGPNRLIARSFPDSMIFHRPIEENPAPAKPVKPVNPAQATAQGKRPSGSAPNPAGSGKQPPPSPPPSIGPDKLQQARTLFEQGAPLKAIGVAEALLDDDRNAFAARMLLARIHANLGENQKAETLCHEALRLNPVASGPHFLLAHLLQERGETESVMALLKKVIYLDRGHIPAYLELASLYQQAGDGGRARKMRESAMDALRRLPPQARLEGYEEWTAEELGRQLALSLQD